MMSTEPLFPTFGIARSALNAHAHTREPKHPRKCPCEDCAARRKEKLAKAIASGRSRGPGRHGPSRFTQKPEDQEPVDPETERRRAYAREKAREGRKLQYTITAVAKELGWKVLTTKSVQDRRGRWHVALAGDCRGFPDYLMVREADDAGAPPQFKIRELKLSSSATLPAEQEAWLTALRDAGADAATWRGAAIHEILDELR